MKNLTPRSLRFIPAALGLLFALLANPAGAALYTWDPQGTVTTPNNGSWYTADLSGSWEGSNWDSATQTGTASKVGWVNDNDVLFAVHTGTGTPAFTVTMTANHTVTGIFDGPDTPNPCQVTISGAGTLVLPSGATPGFDVTSDTANPGSLTIYNVIAGSPTYLEWEGGGSLLLYGNNTFSGGFYIATSGGVSFGHNNAFGTGPITWSVAGFIQPAQVQAYVIPNAMTHGNFVETFSSTSSGVTFGTGAWTLPGSGNTTTLANYNTGNYGITVSSPISGAGALTINTATTSYQNPWTFTGNNTFSGALTITAGTLTIGGSGTLGASASYGGAISIASVNGGAFIYNSSSAQNLTGVISGAGALTQKGSGTLTLSGANTYTGVTTISGGILNANHSESVGISGAFGKSADSNPGNIVMSGGTLQYSSNNSHDFSGRFSTAASQHYNIDVNGRPITYATALTSSGGELTLSDTTGGGTLTLSAANTYAGGTTINAGTLSVNTIADSGTSAIGNSGALNLAGGTLSYSGSAAATTARTVNGSTTTSVIALPSGNLTLSGGPTSIGAFTVTKTGSGTLTLSGTTDNSYLGMNVNAGTVVLNKTSTSGVHALGGTTTVASVATLQLGGSGGYEIFSGVSVTVNSGGVFDLNSQSLTAAGIATLTLSGTGISSGGALVNSTASTTSTLTANSGIVLAANTSIGGSGNITLTSAISGSGMSLAYSGAGTLTLGAANSYSGGTTISSGTLDGSVSGSIPGNVTVSATSGTALKLDNTSAMASSAALTLPASPTAGLVNLNLSGGTQTINAMYWGATSMATGTWGSTTSSAAHQNAAFTGNGLLQINSGGASQTITFPNPGTQTYGVAPITLTATALGGTVTYTVTSGPATVAGSTLTITGAGSVTVQANQAGNNTYDAAPAVNDTFTVDPLPVTLAGNPNKIYDGTTGVAGVDLKVTNPVGADLVFVGGTGGLAGSGFGLQTISSFTSLSLNGPQAANYTLTGASGSVVITAGDTSCNDTLANNNNGGTGFAAWTGVSAPSPGGVYDTGTSPAGDLCATGVWGIYTGTGTATTSVQRPLANSDTLQVGQSLRVDMQNGGINSPGSEGLSLWNASGNAVFELYFSGGATYWTINAGSVSPASAIPYAGTSGGCRAIFTLTGSGTTYSLTVQVPIGGTNYGPYTGSLLSPTGGQSITQLRFYTYDIGNTYNLQFNDLAVGCPTPTVTTQPSPTTVCAGSTASFTAASTTASSPTFQWQVNTGSGWNNVSTGSGGTTGTYMTPATTTGMSGYQYRCVVTDACGVAANSTAATLTVNPLPTASVNSAAVCAGASATLTATTSASSPSYLWNDPSSATTASITVSPASTTTYTVTVTDGTTSCANSGSGTVTVNPLPTASVNSATICAGASATLNATSSASSPGYLWNDPSSATTASITVSPASTTTYTVTVTDGTTGCANSGSGTVTVNSTPATPGTITQANPSGSTVCSGASSVTYSISAVSGATTYTWTVPTGATITAGAGTTSITVAWGTATSGSVQVTAGNTCGASSASSLGVTVDPGPTGPTVSIAPSSSICVGSPATFSVSTASGSPSGYAWRKRDPALGWGAGNNWVFTYNSGGCDSYNGVFIGSATGSGQSPGINNSGQAFGLYANTYNSAEAKRSFGSLSIGQNISFDVQLPVTLTGSDGSGHYSQALFALRNSANEANPRLEMWVLAGSADVTLSDNAGDTTTTLPYNHNGYHCVFTLTGNNAYNLTVTLSDSSSGPYSFSGTLKGTSNDPVNEVRAWLKNYDSAGGSAEDFYFNNIVAGAYEDNASNYTAGGCASTTWTTTPNLGFGPVSSSASYVISSPATTDSGSYDVLVWDSCGQAFASPVTLTVNPLPTASVNSATICAGASATLNATTSASSPGYLWNDPSSATTASITVSPASTTTYTVTVTDGTTGCANSGSGTVTVNPLPTASVNSVAICAGASATLTATTSASSPSYLWNDPSSATTASITVSPASTTTYTVTVTDGTTGCANSGSGTVTVNPLPTVSVNSATTTNCAGGSATLTVTTSASSPSYLWNDPSSATTASITVSPASTTTYTVTVTDGTTGCANSGSGTVTVMVCTTNNLTASPNPALPSQDMTFTATLTAAPGAGTPTGTVLFKTNGVPAGDPIELDGSGVATLTLAAGSLPHGANTVTNEYAGDGDFLGSTNYVMQIVNTPPVASNTTTSVTENTSLVLSVGKLLSLAYDADGDSLSITSAGSTSTNGPADNVVLDNVAGTITYTPATDFVGTDMFSFVVSDTYGGSSTGTVLVTLTSASVPSPNIVVPPAYSNGTFTVTFAGIPGYTYTIQYSPNVTGGPWTTLTTLTADEDDGLFQVIDTESSPPPQRYYRTVGGTPPSP